VLYPAKSPQCLINAVTGEVGPATKMSGNPTNQALACKQRAGDPNGCKILPVFEVKKKSVMKRLIACSATSQRAARILDVSLATGTCRG
jgi:hypothetical protein